MKKALRFFTLCSIFMGCHFASQAQGAAAALSSNKPIQTATTFQQQNRDIFNTDVFIENKGQYEQQRSDGSKVLFVNEYFGPQIQFSPTGITYQYKHWLIDPHSLHEELEGEAGQEPGKEEDRLSADEIAEIMKHAIGTNTYEMNWIGANKKVQISAEGKTDNYYSWGEAKTISYGYHSLRYQNLYPGIDVEYHIDGRRGIKYSIYAKPGADLSQLKFSYKGDKAKLKLLEQSLEVAFMQDTILESAPLSYDDHGKKYACRFSLSGDTVSFQFPESFDTTKPLIIDPWISPITTLLGDTFNNNKGVDVDYDFNGNLYVFGGGRTFFPGPMDAMYARYDSRGRLQWTFMGVIGTPPSVIWSTGDAFYLWGGIVVDKSNGKSYLSHGYRATGMLAVRLDTFGVYDGWMSRVNLLLNEGWNLLYSCSTGRILVAGGSTYSNRIIGSMDTAGTLTLAGFTSAAGRGYQDAVSAVSDVDGTIYIVMASAFEITTANHLYRLTPSYTGFVWSTPTGYNSFMEQDNKTYLGPSSSNGFNALAVNANYLFYYDGEHLKAFNKATGFSVGAALDIVGDSVKLQGGIAADDCNNVYVGGNNGNIDVYTFDGLSFIAQPDMIISGYPGKAVYDILLNKNQNLLYISGEGFVAVQPPSLPCSTPFLHDTILMTCSHIAVGVILEPDIYATYSYVWRDSITGGIVRTVTNSFATSDSFRSALADRTYQLTITKNLVCSSISGIHYIRFSPDSLYTRLSICTGDTVHVGIHHYTSTGLYRDVLTNSYGCDSLIVTDLTVGPNYLLTQNITNCPGEVTIVGSHRYTLSGTYSDTFARAGSACDSVVLTNLTIRTPATYSQTVHLCPRSSYVIGSSVYDTSGTYTDTLNSYFGCDSIVTTTIVSDTVVAYYQSATLCSNVTGVTVGGLYFTSAGDFTNRIIRVGKCDSLVYTSIAFLFNSNTYNTVEICDGDTINVGVHHYTAIGTYLDTLLGDNGCDSIAHTTINASALPRLTQIVTICAGRSLIVGTHVHSRAGTYVDTVAIPGCDSIVTTTLRVTASIRRTINSRICQGTSLRVGTHTYTLAATYVDTLTAVSGCDSIVTTRLSVDTLPVMHQTISLCGSTPLLYHGHVYDSAGLYADTITRTGRCDSVVLTTLNYLANDSTVLDIVFCSGDTLRVGRYVYVATGNFIDTLRNAVGCDSTVITHLQVYPNERTSSSFSICQGDSFFLHGSWRNSSGLYFDTLNSIHGCDSILSSTLTVIPIDTASRYVAICHGASYFCGAALQSTSGIYYDTLNNLRGCDSIITTYLTINSILQGRRIIDLCNGDSFFCAGAFQHIAGNYFDSLVNARGCDSILTTTLIIHNLGALTRRVDKCVGQSYFCGGAAQSSDGTYYDTLSTGFGCDSVLTTNLFFHTAPLVTASPDTIICQNQSALLYASGTGNFIWTGAFVGSTHLVTPLNSALFTVTLSDSFGCSSIDSVFVSVLPLPHLMVHDTSICGGDSALLQASGAIGYLWKLGAGRTSIFNPVLVHPQNSYKYQVVGTDANGCKDSVFEQVSVYPAAVSISAIPDSTVVIGTELHLLANLLQITDSIISWQPEEVIGNANTNPIISTPKQSQMYCVITKNSLGCIAEACIHIKVIPVDDFIAPTAFSPNGDGLNDWFRLTMSPNMELLHFIIVNRWGEEVFNAEQDQHGSAWDGIYKDREQPMGTFVWYAEAKNRLTGNKVSKSGNVTLLR